MGELIKMGRAFRLKKCRNSKESKYLTDMINKSFILNGLPENKEYAQMYATIILLELAIDKKIDLDFLVSNQDRFENEMMHKDNRYGYSTVHEIYNVLIGRV